MILDMTHPVQAALQQERKMEIIANHLANADTTGFKGDIVKFDELYNEYLSVDFSQGDLKNTGNTLDLALADEGFFKVQTPAGTRYTRNGNFVLNNESILVTQKGDRVLGEGGEIVIEGGNVVVNRQGEVFVDGEMIDKLSVVNFESLDKLTKEEGSLFKHPDGGSAEIPAENVAVEQGALEGPNVVIVKEMTNMIETQRTYEAYQKVIQSLDESDAKAINELGQV
jgi:flagellar basal-body rod protein FlgG